MPNILFVPMLVSVLMGLFLGKRLLYSIPYHGLTAIMWTAITAFYIATPQTPHWFGVLLTVATGFNAFMSARATSRAIRVAAAAKTEKKS